MDFISFFFVVVVNLLVGQIKFQIVCWENNEHLENMAKTTSSKSLYTTKHKLKCMHQNGRSNHKNGFVSKKFDVSIDFDFIAARE